MIVRLCQTGLLRFGADGARLVSALRDREITPVPQTCLDRCPVCEKQLVAAVDGMPVAAPSVDALLAIIDELAADDL